MSANISTDFALSILETPTSWYFSPSYNVIKKIFLALRVLFVIALGCQSICGAFFLSPIIFYELLHAIIGTLIFPAPWHYHKERQNRDFQTGYQISSPDPSPALNLRKETFFVSGVLATIFTFDVRKEDSKKVESKEGKREDIRSENNGSCLVMFLGNGSNASNFMRFENFIKQFEEIARASSCETVIVANYPGVDAQPDTSMFPSFAPIANTNQSCILECAQRVLEYARRKYPRRIVGYGMSLGGAVLVHAAKSFYAKHSQIDFTCIVDRTFSSLPVIAKCVVRHITRVINKVLARNRPYLACFFGWTVMPILPRFSQFLVWFFGWTLDPAKLSQGDMPPTLVIQHGKNGQVLHDGVIFPEGALGSCSSSSFSSNVTTNIHDFTGSDNSGDANEQGSPHNLPVDPSIIKKFFTESRNVLQ